MKKEKPEPRSYTRKKQYQSPLLGDIRWGQDEPFNAYTPVQDGRHTLVGCVPVAIAQILKYYNYPTKGKSFAFYSDNDGKVLKVNFDDWKPRWSEIKTNYADDTTPLETAPLSQMLTWISYGINANHGITTTGSSMTNIKHFLCNNLLYSSKLYCHKNISADRLLGLVYKELDNHRPCIVESESHAFVCDGYNGDYLHYNLGWNGFCNGYYRTSLRALSVYDCSNTLLKGVVVGIEPVKCKIKKTLSLSVPGELSKQLTAFEQATITDLTLSGPLNNEDISY